MTCRKCLFYQSRKTKKPKKNHNNSPENIKTVNEPNNVREHLTFSRNIVEIKFPTCQGDASSSSAPRLFLDRMVAPVLKRRSLHCLDALLTPIRTFWSPGAGRSQCPPARHGAAADWTESAGPTDCRMLRNARCWGPGGPL